MKGIVFDVQSAPLYCPGVGFNESVFFSSNESPVNGVRFFLVHNVILHSVSFRDMRESWFSRQVTFIIRNPSGQYDVTEFDTNLEVDVIVGEKYRLQDDIKPITPIAPSDPTLQFNVLDSTFTNNSVSLVIRDPFNNWYSVVGIALRYCSFANSNVSVDTDIAFVNLDLSVNFYNCTWSTVESWMGSLSLNIDRAELLHNCDLSFVTIALDQCLIVGSRTYVNFKNWFCNTNCFFMDELYNTTTPVDGLEQSRIVTVSNSTFHDSTIECDAHYPSAEYVWSPWCEDIFLLTFANITFVKNTMRPMYLYNTASFQIRGFDMFPVVFEGVNTIQDRSGFYLRNSRLYIYNTINITSDFSGMILTFDSFLYLSNNSQLLVDHITVVPHPLAYNDFVRCAVHRQQVENVPTCHSYCFFQPLLNPEVNSAKSNFLDRNLSIVNSTRNNGSHNNVPLFNMKLYVTKNSIPDAWNEPIFNGHLENCALKFGSEDVPLTQALLDQFVVLQGDFDNRSNTPYLFSSPPYHICICDLSRPNDRDSWICNNNTQVEYNLVRKFHHGLVVMGDFHHIKRSFVRVRIDSNDTNLDEIRLFTNSNSCTEVTTSVNNLTPNQKYNLTILAYSAVQNILGLYFSSLMFTIQIQVRGECPLGMVLSNDACDCHPLLKRNNIQCSVSDTDAFFEIPSPYWIGIRGDEVLVSSNCPPFYCSSSTRIVSLSNLTNHSDIVCNALNHRQGILCSGCKQGRSSQFGSYKCDFCEHHDVILPVLLLSLAGVGVVALLFLLNLTVMQGSIIGISFYLHALHVLSELLQGQSTFDILGPALSILGLSLGIGTCFYSGMDEYARGFLRFIFPLYLFTLVIIIIICAHKFNLRIFRVQFIAKRSVPVLATLMLLTYDGLIQAVAFGLYATRIHSSTESSPQVVWVFQADLLYFQGKHLALGLICILVLFFYLLPLTIVLLFGDLFRMCTRSLWYSHFLDVFHGALRYPFGFWLGVRFLLRVVIISLSGSRILSEVSLWISVIVGILLLLQLFIRPYRVDNLPEHALQDTRVRMTFKKALKWRIARLFLPSVVDSMFLGHIIIIAVIFAARESLDTNLADAASSIALLLATIHIIMVACFHIYMYFPFPARTGEWMERFREKLASRVRLLRSRMQRGRNSVMLVDMTSSPISVSYLSASMAMREGDYTSSEDSSDDESSTGEGDRQPICPQTETQVLY